MPGLCLTTFGTCWPTDSIITIARLVKPQRSQVYRRCLHPVSMMTEYVTSLGLPVRRDAESIETTGIKTGARRGITDIKPSYICGPSS
jgi:hypothetical protein